MSTRRLKCIDSEPAIRADFPLLTPRFQLVCLPSLPFLSLSELGRFTASRCCLNNSVPLSTTPRRKTVTEPSSALMYVSFLTCFCDISSCKQYFSVNIDQNLQLEPQNKHLKFTDVTDSKGAQFYILYKCKSKKIR